MLGIQRFSQRELSGFIRRGVSCAEVVLSWIISIPIYHKEEGLNSV